jgi:hypothetical protein
MIDQLSINLLSECVPMTMTKADRKAEIKARYLIRYNARRRELHAKRRLDADYVKKNALASRTYYQKNTDYRELKKRQTCDRYRLLKLHMNHNLIQS